MANNTHDRQKQDDDGDLQCDWKVQLIKVTVMKFMHVPLWNSAVYMISWYKRIVTTI